LWSIGHHHLHKDVFYERSELALRNLEDDPRTTYSEMLQLMQVRTFASLSCPTTVLQLGTFHLYPEWHKIMKGEPDAEWKEDYGKTFKKTSNGSDEEDDPWLKRHNARMNMFHTRDENVRVLVDTGRMHSSCGQATEKELTTHDLPRVAPFDHLDPVQMHFVRKVRS